MAFGAGSLKMIITGCITQMWELGQTLHGCEGHIVLPYLAGGILGSNDHRDRY